MIRERLDLHTTYPRVLTKPVVFELPFVFCTRLVSLLVQATCYVSIRYQTVASSPIF